MSVSLIYRTKTDNVITINFPTYNSISAKADNTRIHIFDSGLISPTPYLGAWFGDKFYKLYNNSAGELLLVSVAADGTETTHINFGVKPWQSAYLLNLAGVQLVALGKTDLEATYYLYDLQSSSYPSFTWTEQSSRIWCIKEYKGKLYFVGDSEVYSCFVGAIPQPIGFGDQSYGGVLFEFGGTLYGAFPPAQVDGKKLDETTGKFVDVINLGVQGTQPVPAHTSAVVFNSQVHVVAPHQYGRIYVTYNGANINSLNLPYEASASGSDGIIYHDKVLDRLLFIGRTYLSDSVVWDLSKNNAICKVSDSSYIWHYF